MTDPNKRHYQEYTRTWIVVIVSIGLAWGAGAWSGELSAGGWILCAAWSVLMVGLGIAATLSIHSLRGMPNDR